MFIILEGCDGAGKSTLAATLCDRYNLKCHHEGPPPTDVSPLEHYGGILESYRWSLKRNEIKGVVFDRLALGERVYGPIYRSEDRFNQTDWTIFRRLLLASGAVHIICQPDFDTCLHNWNQRKGREMIQDASVLRRIYDAYAEIKEEANPYVMYDYTVVGELDRLEAYLAELPQYTKTFEPGVIGNPFTAKFLFIGDKGARPGSWITDLPFFGMVNSSAYLNCAIADAGFKEEEIALVNSHRHDGQNVEWPKVRTNIALGRNAQYMCRLFSLPYEKMPHPQFWKRFHARDYEGYVQMLTTIRKRHEPS